jgi:hypothetical protein
MRMGEVLKMMYKESQMYHPDAYAFVLENTLIPLDQTVASLGGKVDLLLVRRSRLGSVGVNMSWPSIRALVPRGVSILHVQG